MAQDKLNPFSSLDTLFGTSATVSSAPTVIENNTEIIPIDDALIDENNDVAFARANLKKLSDDAAAAILDIGELARATDAPRAFEVLSTMINTAASVNKQLIELHKLRTKSSSTVENSSTTTVHNQQNIVFTGSPSELLANLKQLNTKP